MTPDELRRVFHVDSHDQGNVNLGCETRPFEIVATVALHIIVT